MRAPLSAATKQRGAIGVSFWNATTCVVVYPQGVITVKMDTMSVQDNIPALNNGETVVLKSCSKAFGNYVLTATKTEVRHACVHRHLSATSLDWSADMLNICSKESKFTY